MKSHLMFAIKVALAMWAVNAFFDLLKTYANIDIGNYYDYPVSTLTGKNG